MKTVIGHHALDSGPLTLVFDRNINDEHNQSGKPASPTAFAHLITCEADMIANALFEHLPMAVNARIMARLLERYGSNFLGGPKR